MNLRVVGAMAALACLAWLSVAASAELPPQRVFTFDLRMSDVDSVDQARAYNGGTPTGRLIGFRSRYSASKRLPYLVGPGPVRAYVETFPEGRERRITITLGGQTRFVVLDAQTPRYHQSELVFDLPRATDLALFEATSVDGEPQRIIWERTLLTNDPDQQYTNVGRNKQKVIRRPAVVVNPRGNLVPNSGFEEGIEGWDVTAYKSNTMVKPSLLSGRAAHGSHSMDVGQIPITSRWFRLAGGRRYTLSLFVAADNSAAVVLGVEVRGSVDKPRQLLEVQMTDLQETDVAGWRQFITTFTSALEEESNSGEHRLTLSARAEGKPVLVDSIQITEGNQPQPYAPHLGLEANFNSPTTQAIFECGKPGDVYFNLSTDQAVQVKQVRFRVTDYFDREVQAETDIAARHTGRYPAPFPTDRVGFFRVRTRIDYVWLGESRSSWRDFFYNVVHPSQPRKDRLTWSLIGGYFTAAPQGDFSYAEITRRFGIFEFNTLGHPMGRWLANMQHDPTDPKKPLRGRYDFKAADQQWERFREHDINTIINFHVKPSGGYGVAFGLGETKGEHFSFSDGQTFASAGWLEFVSAFVTHFKGRISRYVVQDEPYQSFTPEAYAAFYLATRQAIKQADPEATVFLHGGYNPMPYIEQLNRLSKGQAHQQVDAVYLYLTQQHSGPVSRNAEPEFRQWVRQHGIPVLTPTCFSPGANFSDRALTALPDYLRQRVVEFRSIQHLFDGLIWGQSRGFYYYYGSHPAGGYASLFDRFGRVIPMVHFYSAANAMVGDVVATQSIDEFDALRIGVIQTARGKTFAVLYSVDGNLYQLEADGSAITGARDSFGNPAHLRREGGRVTVMVGPQPSYLEVSDAVAATDSLRIARVTPKIPFHLTFDRTPTGSLLMRALLSCDEPLDAWTLASDVYQPERTSIVRAQNVAPGLYEICVPVLHSPAISLNAPQSLHLSTNLGEAYINCKPAYAAVLKGSPSIDGQLSAQEWPLVGTQTIPLRQGEASADSTTAAGHVALMRVDQHLSGLVLLKDGKDVTVTLRIAPQNPVTGLPLTQQVATLTIKGDEAKLDGRTDSRIVIAHGKIDAQAAELAHRMTDMIEFALPLAALPHLESSEGNVWSVRIHAQGSRMDVWWPGRFETDDVEPQSWGAVLQHAPE